MTTQKFILIMALMVSAFALLAGEDLKAQTRIKGERLDPDTYGPVVIESMEAAIERDRAVKRPLGPESKERNGEPGLWKVPSRRATSFPYSGEHYAMNLWGDTCMGIAFPGLVDVHGAYFSGHGEKEVWTQGIRVLGYCSGEKVQETEWFRAIGAEPHWMAMDLQGVDRIEIVSQPVLLGGGWYAMDDLTYSVHSDSKELPSEKVIVHFDDLSYNTKLTGSGYGGLTWETGTGDFSMDESVHSPKVPPDHQQKVPVTGRRTSQPSRNGGTLPTLITTYQAVIRGDAGSMSYPPDTDGAIGPNHFVETVNRNFAVYDKATGAELVNILLGSFLPGSNGDPRVVFDQHSNRWIVIVTDFSATASVFLAVSLTDDPTGGWFKGSFVTAQGVDAGKWPDYPTLGVDAHGIYTAAYMVGGVNGMTIFAIDKAPLVAPTPQMGTITAYRELPWEGAIQPAHTYGMPQGEYLVSISSSSSLRVRRIDPPLTAPTLIELGSVSVPSFSDPPNAPALGSTVPLNTIDDRLMMSVYRDGSIWTSHTIDASGRAGCRWYEIDADSMSLIQSGTVADSSLYYFYPSIMVNQFGNVAMGFSGSNSSQYAGCYYTGRIVGDPPGEMAPPQMFKEGTGPQNNIDGYGRNRWGDYSYTTLDPVDQDTLWTIQEYGHENNIWGTYMAVLVAEKPPLVLSFPEGMPQDQSPGLSSSITVQIVDGSETYVPGTGKIHYRYEGGTFLEAQLTPLGNDLYEALLPNTKPGDQPEYYFSAEGDGGSTVYSPHDAPSSFYSFDVYFLEVVMEEDFESPCAWTVESQNLQTGEWERADPAGTDAQPEDDHTEDGTMCYVTGKAGGSSGNDDVDGGPTRLISPTIDLSSGDAEINFYLWFYHSDYGTQQPLEIHLSDNNGASWTKAADIGHNPGWTLTSYTVSDHVTPTSQVKIRFTANDNPNDDIVEALVDDFQVSRYNYDPSLWADAYSIPAGVGDEVNFSLDAGVSNANRQYLLLGSVSGTTPGFTLPGGLVTMPLNWDVFTDFVIALLNTPVFSNFLGYLDGSGQGTAQLTAPPVPGFVGTKMHFAFALSNPWDFASNAMEVDIVP